jgi:hypothetical protein
MIPKSGNRFSDKIMLQEKPEHDLEKWEPVFGQDHAQAKRRGCAGRRPAFRLTVIAMPWW